MPVAAGDTFLLPKKIGHAVAHLWVVLTDPDDSDPPHVAIVNLTSTHIDGSVVLSADDHAFVTHETYIYYQDAKIAPADKLSEAVKAGIAIRHDPFRAEVLERIQDGVSDSPQCTAKIREYCEGRF